MAPKKPAFCFKMNIESAHKKFLFMKEHNISLTKALQDQSGSPLDFGSEFKPVSFLKTIFGKHQNWTKMEAILRRGSDWPMEELSTEDKLEDLKEALEFGNHKGAKNNPKLLKKLVEKDITHGYSLVLPLDKTSRIHEALMVPMNIMKQNKIDEHGRIIEKDRLTHDQSYK